MCKSLPWKRGGSANKSGKSESSLSQSILTWKLKRHRFLCQFQTGGFESPAFLKNTIILGAGEVLILLLWVFFLFFFKITIDVNWEAKRTNDALESWTVDLPMFFPPLINACFITNRIL